MRAMPMHDADDGLCLYRPGPPLAEHIEFFGHWRHRGTALRSRALPRGAVTVIVDVGERQRLDCYAADGLTNLDVAPAAVTGPHSTSYISNIAADEPVVAIHFRPGGAFPFLGIPLGDLEGTSASFDQIWGPAGHELHERLIAAQSAAARFGILEAFLLSRARFSTDRQAGVALAVTAIEANPSVRMAEVRDLAGLSTKRLIAQFRAEIGLSPKAYARVRRLQAALRHLGTGTTNGAHIAADIGYCDQSHFLREFRSFTEMTPSQYSRQPFVLPSHISPTAQISNTGATVPRMIEPWEVADRR